MLMGNDGKIIMRVNGCTGGQFGHGYFSHDSFQPKINDGNGIGIGMSMGYHCDIGEGINRHHGGAVFNGNMGLFIGGICVGVKEDYANKNEGG